jgi:hypothetical protein
VEVSVENRSWCVIALPGAGDSEDLSFPLSEAMPTAHIAIRTLKSNFLCGIASSSSLSAVRSTTMGSAVLAFALKLLFS